MLGSGHAPPSSSDDLGDTGPPLMRDMSEDAVLQRWKARPILPVESKLLMNSL